MLLKKLWQTRKADADLAVEIRAALVESLFAPIISLTIGAINCSLIGMAVALSVGSRWIMADSAAIFVVGSLRVISAYFYRRSKHRERTDAVLFWEHVYEYGAWAFSGLLGVLCWLTLAQTTHAALHMVVITTATGYAAAISGRNAGRPFIAVGQLTLIALPMTIGLLLYPDWIYKVLGFVGLLFIWGTTDISLGIRDAILQALTMTRKEAAIAARFAEQAKRFDVALNNMSHGLCMLDEQDRVQVWNDRFLEILHLEKAPIRVGMPMVQLVRHSIRAGNHKSKRMRQIIADITESLSGNQTDQLYTTFDGERTIALSRRLMDDGGAVIILEDVTERKRAQERIIHLAKFDELTGLANRTQFHERITVLLAALKDTDSRLAIHLIDLDHFKEINDTLGHPLGDKLLKEVAERLRDVTDSIDMITRFGGDEFVVLQTGIKRDHDVRWLAQRLARILKDPFDIDGHRIDIGASIGIAMAPKDGTDADELLKKADMALYAAKTSGGGVHRLFAAEMEQAAKERRALKLDLRDALVKDQFYLHFQPLVDLHTGQITSCEALLRWAHPERGMVSPATFIPVAEETGLIIALGEWALNSACAEAASWPGGVKVAVNLSPIQFKDRGLPLQIVSALAKSGLSPQRLDLEVTERLLLEESAGTLATMDQIKNLGVNLSLDDFGTGYSSLNYLRKFPFHKIKIDRSFICDLGQERDARAIIGAVASLGTGLDKIVVAEGIETDEQRKLVTAQGCHEGQGYLFGRPMSGAAIRALLQEQAARPRNGKIRVA